MTTALVILAACALIAATCFGMRWIDRNTPPLRVVRGDELRQELARHEVEQRLHRSPPPAAPASGDPLVSGIVAAATGSTIAGWLVGGDITGAILGDALDGDLRD